MAKNSDTPITVSTILKYGGIFATCLTVTVSGAWAVASLRNDTDANKQKITEVDQSSIQRDQENERRLAEVKAQNERDIQALKIKTDAQNKTISEISTKLDIAVTILQRIDQKVNQP